MHSDWKFSDGTPVTPEDYIFSCTREKNNKADASWMMGNVASMEKTGDHQITIRLKTLDVDFLKLIPNSSLGLSEAKVVREHGGTDAPDAATKDTATTWLDQHSVGTGPFMIDHWDRGSEMVLKANPYYWGPKTFDTVVFRFVTDPTTQRDLLLRGDAHLALNLTPDLAADLQKRGAASKTAIATVPALGMPNGFSFKLTYGADQIIQNVPASDVVQKVKEDLAAVGIDAQLAGEPLTQELTDYRAAKADAVLHLWAVDYPGWTDFLPVYGPGGHVGLARQKWAVDSSPEAKQIADLIAKATATVDPKAQLEPALQAQRLINQYGPYSWLFETNYQLGYRTDVIKKLAIDYLSFFDIPSSEFV